MRNLTEINKSIIWDEKIQKVNELNKSEQYFWDFVLTIPAQQIISIFETLSNYYNFLGDFWYRLNPNKVSKILMQRLYDRKKKEINSNEELFFFFAHKIEMDFTFFEILLAIHPFLFLDLDKVEEKDKEYYTKFWTHFFNQKIIPVNFLNKHYLFFLKNKSFFKDLICKNPSFFHLNQSIITKFKQ